jgi:hypothetical protein
MKTFQQIATELGVPYCNGIDRGFRCHQQHDLNGSLVNGTIHLRDRQSNRANTLVMLKMVAHAGTRRSTPILPGVVSITLP